MAENPTYNIDHEKFQSLIKETMLDVLSSKEVISQIADLLVEVVAQRVSANLSHSLAFNIEQTHTFQNNLKETNNHLAKLEKTTDEKTDELEQYSRRNSIRAFGIKENKNENTITAVISLLNSKLRCKISTQDLDACHRVGKILHKDKPRPILIKFVSRIVRDSILSVRKDLRGSELSLQEDLTPLRAKILRSAQERIGRQHVWSSKGNVLTNISGQISVIRSLEDVSKLPQLISISGQDKAPNLS